MGGAAAFSFGVGATADGLAVGATVFTFAFVFAGTGAAGGGAFGIGATGATEGGAVAFGCTDPAFICCSNAARNLACASLSSAGRAIGRSVATVMHVNQMRLEICIR